MMRARVCFQLAWLLVSISLATGTLAQTPAVKVLGSDTLTFEEAGSRVGSGQAEFTSSVSGLNFKFYDNRASIDITAAGASDARPIHLSLSGANQRPLISPEGQLPGIVSRFPSGDTRTWRTNLRTWSGLRYQEIYPGIDLAYYGNRGQLEYDFVVAPQHDPKTIALDISSADEVNIASGGALTISGSGASLRFSKPVIYQLAADGSRQLLAGKYVMKSAGQIGFDIPNWDRTRPLVIDPVLLWSSFPVGSVSGDSYNAVAIDSSSNVYLAGRSSSGALTVEKISSDGATLVYRAVLTATPSYGAVAEDIRVDSAGNAYIVGYSGPNFPTTSNAFLGSVTAGNHAFVAVLNAAGTALTYATYLAGTTSSTDQANGVALDSTNKIYVTGYTGSSTFPTTTGVYQTKNPNGQPIAFVAKIDATKSGAASLIYSTYLSGPTYQSTENAIAVDGSGNAYVAGNGYIDFPTTAGAFAYDGEGVGSGGVYITKLNPTATALVYSAYLGVGTANGITVDGSGDAYVAGTTAVEDFPTTTGAFQVIYPGSFASELNAAGTALVYSTFLNGALETTTPTDIAIEAGCLSACNAFVTGYTGEDDLALTNPIQNFNASYVNGSSGNDVFVTELNGTGTAAVYSTYVGGSSDDSAQSTAHSPGIAANTTGDAFVVGETSSIDFPVTLTANPYRNTFALRIGAAAGAAGVVYPATLSFSTAQPVGAASTPLVVTLRNMGSNAMPITSITPSPSDYSEINTCGSSVAGGGECAITVTFTPSTAASRPGTLTIVQGGDNSPNVVNLTGTGTSQPFVTLSPATLTFANQTVDTASPYQTVTVSNAATTSLTLSNPPFSISSNFAQTNNCPSSLAQNATCTVNIAFLPTQNGAFSGQMYVNSNTNGLATTYVSLSGNGVVGAPALTLSSAGMMFNPQVIGTSSFAQTLTVSNTSNVPVTIFGISVTGTANLDYTASGCVTTVYPGGQCGVRVIFVPTATGARAATVTLADSTTAAAHSFTVTGTGVAPTLTLMVTPSSLTFADQGVGSTSSNFPVTVFNSGDAPVIIDRVYTTGDFRLYSTGCVITLRVGSYCSTNVQFAPTATGARSGTLVFEDNATGSPQSIVLKGNGLAAAPLAIATPDSLNFGTQAQGTTTPNPLTVNLENIGNVPFDASNVSITGANAADFQLSYQGCLSVIVTPGRICQVQVTFTPTATGARAATLTFTNGAGTQTASLSGTGVAATYTLGLTPSAMTFQAQQKGVQSPAQNAWLINTGTAPITVSKITSSNTDYQVSGCVGSAIQPNTSCAIYVYLTPTVTTTDNATLTITSNATVGSQTITVTGSGATAAPTMQVSPSGLAFSSQVVSTTSAIQFVQVTNNSASTVTGITIATTGTNAADFTISSNSCTATLAATSACGFYVAFKPSAAVANTAAVTITDSAGTQTVALAGYGVASTSSALLLQSVLQFPKQTVGFTSPNQSATFENTGDSPLTISSVSLGGTNPGDFNMSACSTASPLAAFSSCNVNVTFTPTAAGARTATVTITYTGAAGSPAVITLSGMGVTPSTGLEIGPTAIAFPPQVITTQSPISPYVLLTNTGTSPVTINSIALSGPNAADFTPSNGCPLSPSTLQQGPLGNTCNVYVNFTPGAAGARTATLTVTDSAGSPTVITLTGTGVAETKLLTVTPTTLVFGPQVTGTTSAVQYITVTNTGNFTVTFTNVTITTNYALSNSCTGQLGPGSSCSIGVTFTPTSTGTKTGTVTITDNATASPQKVTLSGMGIATTSDIQLSQTAVVFDAQSVSTQSPAQIVYYYNQGNTAVTISSLVLGGANPGDFSTSGSGCSAGGQVSALSYCTLRILFTPAAAGARSASLTITDSDPGSPRVIALSGTGISSSVPEVLLTPSSLTFATQSEGTTSAPQNINLTNNGSGSLTISSIVIAGTDPNDYKQTNNCPATLAAGFSCNIAVTFSPTATGTRTATVTATDSATGSPHSATLTGTGKAGALPVVTLTPPSLAFPNVALNTTSKQTVTVKNTGTAALSFTSITISGTVTSDFSQTNTCTGSIAVNGTCTITVSFTPSTFEDQTGTVTLTDNAANSPQSITITGNGAEAAVYLSPSSLTFSSQAQNTTSAPQVITVENYGNATLTLSSVTISGPFLISANTCGTSLTAGAICTISVEFNPKGAGTFFGALVLTDNAGDSPQMVELSGTGIT
ncbi:MAG TPA: choice-of-anchor D domain-containing protein [Candidatus Binatus sp.]|nr:choice-of-anchor D domain-containing protein [Candidatus Binatus sp.]HWY21515.1 choice-of-anchor D domain-containing protein [Candidatus Acidoferrum sp.]